MRRGGRVQKPDSALALAGTGRADRPRTEGVIVEVLTVVPDPPAWLSRHAGFADDAIAEWRRLAPILVKNGLLAEQDIQTLANLCYVQAKIMKAWDERGLHGAYKQYAAALGLAVAWRSRVPKNGEEQKKQTNPFEALKGSDWAN